MCVKLDNYQVPPSCLIVLYESFKSADEGNASTRTSGSNSYVAIFYKPKDLNAQHQCCGNFKLRKIQSSPLTFGRVSQSSMTSERLPYFQGTKFSITTKVPVGTGGYVAENRNVELSVLLHQN